MIYSLVLTLLKTVFWPNLRHDTYLYPTCLLVPSLLNFAIRLITILVPLQENVHWLHYITSTFSLFLTGAVPLVAAVIATFLSHRFLFGV